MPKRCDVRVRFCPPPSELRRYFTTFYLAEWVAPGDRLEDVLLPEWANLRFLSGSCADATPRTLPPLMQSCFPVTGPSSEAMHFSLGSARMWGIGLLPLGWAKFVDVPACEYANRVVDGASDPAFASFVPLASTLFGAVPDEEAELARITRHFMDRLDVAVADEARITAIHTAIVDPDVGAVSDIAEHAGVSQRTIERICKRTFGFSPKILLRRQRFMRSLSHFMSDPSLKWIGAIDGHYHDQAQFVRDFRQFMGMSPRQYAAMDKPLIGAVMSARARFFGSSAPPPRPPDHRPSPDCEDARSCLRTAAWTDQGGRISSGPCSNRAGGAGAHCACGGP